MKKIFLILSMLVCFQACHAVGVDCWEEPSATYRGNEISRMQEVLGSSAKIKLVNAKLKGIMYEPGIIRTTARNLEIALHEPLTVNARSHNWALAINKPLNLGFSADSKKKDKYYLDTFYLNVASAYKIVNDDNDTNYYNNETGIFITGNPESTINSNTSSSTVSYFEFIPSSYVLTFCVANTNSGGGGGGSAGAAVNYIIKAN